MKIKVAIYLAGSIKKGHEKTDQFFWTDSEMNALSHLLDEYELLFLNPAFRNDDLSDPVSVFGRDMLQVFSSNLVAVDARGRRGLGVGAEMMWAKMNDIPVITWAPKNSHYCKEQTTVLGVSVSNFVHPFVESLSDKIVENLAEMAHWVKVFVSNSEIQVKGVPYIRSAIQHYKESQLDRDQPMKELLRVCPKIQAVPNFRTHSEAVAGVRRLEE